MLPGYVFGFLQGRIVQSIGDTLFDPDRLGDGRPAIGNVVFNPTSVLEYVPGTPTTAIVRQSVTAAIDSQGYITDLEALADPSKKPGIYLATGAWTATFVLKSGGSLRPKPFWIDSDSTESNPYDLFSGATYVPPVGTIVYTMALPGNASFGDVLTWDNGPVWRQPTGGNVGPSTELTPDPVNPGLYFNSGSFLTPDPGFAGLFSLGTGSSLTPDPANTGLYLIGA